MASGFFSSLFRDMFGSGQEAKPDQEMVEISDQSVNCSGDSHKQNDETQFEYSQGGRNVKVNIEDGYTETEQQGIYEMLAEIASGETGYSSDTLTDTSSFENISINANEHTAQDVIRGSSESSWHTTQGGPRTLNEEEIRIECDRSENNQDVGLRYRGHIKGSDKDKERGKIEEVDSSNAEECKISTISNFKFDLQKVRSGTKNVAFEADGDPIESASNDSGEEAPQWPVPLAQRRQSAAARWRGLAENKDLIVNESSDNVLKTNPIVAARLLQSYKRTKDRTAEKKLTVFDTFAKVHFKRLKFKLHYFIDHNADPSYQFKKKKYYWESSSSSDDDDDLLRQPYDPYSVRKKKKWWMKKPKTCKERLRQYKFYGKKSIYRKSIQNENKSLFE